MMNKYLKTFKTESQLTPEQQGFVLHVSTYTQIFFQPNVTYEHITFEGYSLPTWRTDLSYSCAMQG